VETRDTLVDADMLGNNLQTPQTSHTTSYSRKRSRSKSSDIEEEKNKLIDLAHQVLTNNDSYWKKNWLPTEQQRFIALKLISNIMYSYYGRVGKLKEDANVFCGGFIPNSHLTSQFVPPSKLSDTNESLPTSNIFSNRHFGARC
jgi:hypothetical protein